MSIQVNSCKIMFQTLQVAWLRSDSKAILAIHTHMVTNNPRMSVNHNGHNSWTLNIDVVQRNDSGLYMCQINTEPMTSQVRNKKHILTKFALYEQFSELNSAINFT